MAKLRQLARCSLVWLVIGSAACIGEIGDPGNAAPIPGDGPASEGALSHYGPIEVRRLSRHELERALADLLQLDAGAELNALSPDPQTPFDNDVTTQSASTSLIEGINLVSRQLGERLLAERTPLEALLPCVPSAADDSACLRQFIAHFGRRALRRPLSADEVDEFVTLGQYSEEADDFLVGAALVVSALLQDLEFLYRVEVGQPVAGQANVRRLNGFEIATRLSFLLWGTIPDDALLDAAAAGSLDDAAGIRTWIATLLARPQARDQVNRFHALWLDYDRMPLDPALAASMTQETEALIERVVFDDGRPWSDLFLSDETYVDGSLATHYGMPNVTGPTWVSYPDSSKRRGLLSHGAFLSVGGKFGDTSPVLRGKNVMERLLCRQIPPPPPDVNADDPPVAPAGAVCKPERYTMATTSGCKSCHANIDPIGFGLENYGPDGAWRDVEPDEPSCAISGEGQLAGFGGFRGAGELGALLAGSDELSACMTQQLYQFAVGRPPLTSEAPLLAKIATDFHKHPDLRELLTSLAVSDAFRFVKIADPE